MERLTGLDAGFLYMETPSQHMHTLKIAVLDPATVPGGYSFPRVKQVLQERLHLLPPFRRRLVPVPLAVHHPLWAEDPDFSLDHHLLRRVVPEPGGRAELDALVGEIASTPLDRTRPLWELVVVEGLAHGNVAFVTKIHHSAADGVRAAELLLQVLDAAPDVAAPPPPRRPWRPERVPSRVELFVGALLSLARDLLGLPRLLVRTFVGLRDVVKLRRTGDVVSPPPPFSTTSTSFNRALTPRRAYASVAVSLDDVKAVKVALDVTLNDVVLAMCAGALRRYLEANHELPDRPLLAGVPVSTRGAAQGELGNRVSNMFTALPVQLADPLERIRAVAAVTVGAKAQHNALGADMLADWSEITPPAPFAGVVRLYSRLHLADRHRPPINLVVSNVPGPCQPLFIAGARLVEIQSVGPILEGIGLNITVWSYLDQLTFGILACRDTLPDVPRGGRRPGRRLDELQGVIGRTRSGRVGSA